MWGYLGLYIYTYIYIYIDVGMYRVDTGFREFLGLGLRGQGLGFGV